MTAFDPRDLAVWEPAYRALLDHVSTGAIAITGVRNNVRERIDGAILAGCDIVLPYQEAPLALILSHAPCIESHPYLGDREWRNGIDDRFRSGGRNQFSAMMVSKPDVARCFPFGVSRITSGAAGRPTSMHLLRAELARRISEGIAEVSLASEAAALAAWLTHNHPEAPPATEKTIRNALREDFRKNRKA